MNGTCKRPAAVELRLSAFGPHRGAVFPLSPLTVFAGESGAGKSAVLRALALLGRLADGAVLAEAGASAACTPLEAGPDADGRRGFRVGCTVDGPVGPVSLDLAVQTGPELRVAGERLSAGGRTLLSTALVDPGLPTVQAAWHTAGHAPVTRAPLPGDRLATALVPLRVAGTTEGQRTVLAAAEQVLVALRGVFPMDPDPRAMRRPARARDVERALLRGDGGNLSAVLARAEEECPVRYGHLVNALRAVSPRPVAALTSRHRDGTGPGGFLAAVDRGGPSGTVPVSLLGGGELRFLAFALVLLTGPGILQVDQVSELLPALQLLTVAGDDLDRSLGRRQCDELLALAARMCERGHIRLLGTVRDAEWAGCLEDVPGAAVVRLDAAGARVPVPRRVR
ncbi:ATP-binding protein [Streptomyces sp. NPDC059506]|uniref:ATP-binding protein n=1 Tax=Streptomyces TaxID=1883 RepID=UPI0015F97EB2|nr:ATP-binding protein [Streptomyces sp. SCUT-3]